MYQNSKIVFDVKGGALHGLGWDGPPRKIKKLMTVGLFYEILNNFVAVLVFDKSKSPLIVVVAYLVN